MKFACPVCGKPVRDWPCPSCGFSSHMKPVSVLDKLQDVRGLKALHAKKERKHRAQQAAEQEARKQQLREAAERRAREARKYKCPDCEEIIILTPEEYERGLGYAVRPRETYSCPYCPKPKPKPKGFFHRIIDRILAPK